MCCLATLGLVILSKSCSSKARRALGGEPLQIVGTLTGATSEPHLWADPMRLSLQGTGAATLSLEATLDRREAVAVDHLKNRLPPSSRCRLER